MIRLDSSQVAEAKRQLESRRSILVRLANDPSVEMDDLDRTEIIKYLANGLRPEQPSDIPSLMRSFIKSCYTYSVLRKYGTRVLGQIPTPGTIGLLLEMVFAESSFLDDETWYPKNLYAVAMNIQRQMQFDLTSNQPMPRMLRVMLDGSKEMAKRLASGLQPFYELIEQVSASSPEAMWKFVVNFAKPIYNVGPALICDFIKEIGFVRFVKVDHHFLGQFKGLFGGYEDCRHLSNKRHFLLSQWLADAVEIEPYYLDRILYEWGRYGFQLSNYGRSSRQQLALTCQPAADLFLD